MGINYGKQNTFGIIDERNEEEKNSEMSEKFIDPATATPDQFPFITK
jgi:hypothetical protein